MTDDSARRPHRAATSPVGSPMDGPPRRARHAAERAGRGIVALLTLTVICAGLIVASGALAYALIRGGDDRTTALTGPESAGTTTQGAPTGYREEDEEDGSPSPSASLAPAPAPDDETPAEEEDPVAGEADEDPAVEGRELGTAPDPEPSSDTTPDATPVPSASPGPAATPDPTASPTPDPSPDPTPDRTPDPQGDPDPGPADDECEPDPPADIFDWIGDLLDPSPEECPSP